ncbi:MAG: 5'-methylthioadenosine/S-adenosylhomocysteine nucleosidase [Clostridia bacterium]|nr:5'-methylthioadenosine/S-adenosylhomocysteine nucleosidase [Clostridia bacterium]
MGKDVKIIGMVVAMDKEITPFLSTVGERISEEVKGPFTVFGYELYGKKIYLIKSGIGEIFASAATQLLISEYKVDIIMNFGVCGSLTKTVGVLDTVIVEGVVHYDFDLSGIDDVVVGQYPGYQTPLIKTDENLLEICKSAMPNSSVVICASADKFVSDSDIKTRLYGDFGAKVCDMESAGILLTAKGYNVPTVIIKAVSDGEGGAEEFAKCVHSASTQYIGALKEIIKEF